LLLSFFFFFLIFPPPPISTLFPYTTLFRSACWALLAGLVRGAMQKRSVDCCACHRSPLFSPKELGFSSKRSRGRNPCERCDFSTDGGTVVVDYHGRFVWYELLTTDVAAAKVFYTNVGGWGPQDAPTSGEGYPLFPADKAFASGLRRLPEGAKKAGGTPRWIGYVGVNGGDAAVDKVKRCGGAVHVP